MKKGKINLIHILDKHWIFTYHERDSIFRVPFYHNNLDDLKDGQEVTCKLEMIQGVEVALLVKEN